MKASNKKSEPVRISSPTVGIIGYGRFGQLAAKYISERTKVVVYDTRKVAIGPRSAGIKKASLRKVASQPIVILAVPVSAVKETLRLIRPYVSKKVDSSIVIDVCSVKAKPIHWMKTILPKNVQILATHPLFGPDSAQESLLGHRIFVTPVRMSERTFQKATRLLHASGLIVERMSARQHDKMIAETLFMTQYVGRLVSATNPAKRRNATTSYSDLMKIVKIADNDTRELFRDMLKYNLFARKTLWKLVRAHQTVLKDLGKQ